MAVVRLQTTSHTWLLHVGWPLPPQKEGLLCPLLKSCLVQQPSGILHVGGSSDQAFRSPGPFESGFDHLDCQAQCSSYYAGICFSNDRRHQHTWRHRVLGNPCGQRLTHEGLGFGRLDQGCPWLVGSRMVIRLNSFSAKCTSNLVVVVLGIQGGGRASTWSRHMQLIVAGLTVATAIALLPARLLLHLAQSESWDGRSRQRQDIDIKRALNSKADKTRHTKWLEITDHSQYENQGVVVTTLFMTILNSNLGLA